MDGLFKLLRLGFMKALQIDNKKYTVEYATAEVGRNDPCPCGSGSKYKKCCGQGK